MKRNLTLYLALLLIAAGASARTLRVLTVGNSFSRDAVEQYFHEIAAAEGDTAIVGSLFIGGCPISRHVDNLRSNAKSYDYRYIGADGKRIERSKASIADALADDKWDIISVQQASPLSGKYDTYAESLPELLNYLRKNGPKKAIIVLHQTWAYQQGSTHSGFKNYGNDQLMMYRAIVDANKRAAKLGKIKTIIPAGTAVQNARTTYIGDNMNRDGYHLDLGVGRFTAALAWYGKLFGKDVTAGSWAPSGMNPDLAKAARAAAAAAIAKPDDVTDLSNLEASSTLYKQSDVPVEIRVDDLLKRMTLDEKVLQLNQYILGEDHNPNNVGAVDNIPAEIGSLICFDTVPDARNAMQRRAMEQSRLGIPVIFGHDVIHGFRTTFPIPLAQACSWNPALTRKASAVAAQEAAMSGIDWTFSPMVDVAHDPRWGRVAEGYGEDPYANSVFGAAAVRGYQGKNLADTTTVAACMKHYVGYGASEAGRDYVYTEISPQTLWDTYLPSFQAGIKAGAATVMSSFNNISGIPGSANHYTLTDVLKNRWHHDGFVVSDWGAVQQLINQGIAADKREAAELALNAGLEMDMMSNAYDKHLAELVAAGKVSQTTVDDAVRRVLRLKFRLGLFERPYTGNHPDRFLRPASLKTAEKLAAESMVLLKNDSTLTLPLRDVKKIAVIGPLAKDQGNLLGSWASQGRPDEVVTWYEGIVNEFGKDAEIRYAAGCGLDGDDASGFKEAADAAAWADVVILCLGEDKHWSGENASRSTIALPAIQEQLAQTVAAAGKPVVLVLSNGRPLELCRLEPISNAILEAWQPGIRGGNAMAGILSGRINPSGKLAITFPYTTGQIPIYYNRRPSARPHQGFYQDITSQPLYPFGHGLSYTTFSYGEPTVSKTEFTSSDKKLTVTVPVTNTGNVEGAETVMWYVCDPYCSITRPVKELKYFEKKTLKPGETKTFTFEIKPMRDLGFVDSKGKRFLEKGEYRILVGDKTISLQMK